MQMSGRRKIDAVLSAFREIRQNRHLDLGEFAQAILQQLKTVCEPFGCAIMIIEGGKVKTIAQEGIPDYAWGIEIRVDTAALGTLRNHQEGLQVNNINQNVLSGLIPAGREAKSVLCVPVMQGDVVVGVIYLDAQKSEAFDQEDLCCADLMAEELSLALQRSLIEARVDALSRMDAMVGCFNRAALEEDMKSEISRSKRYEKKFSLFFLEFDAAADGEDVPETKTNDLLHPYMARIFKRNIRNIDKIYFYEDKKFVVMLPETDKVETITVASRLIDMICQGQPEDPSGVLTDQKVAISIGISGYPDDGNSNGDLLNAAQIALRQAKSQGGNKLCVSGETIASVGAPAAE